ncbi:hypothetical protein Ddye_026218 [Dipteronia dyeriana]|uniref:RNase H type-1 domain-containing protein n=1 Tax=Dipteronia dyeriana TaxID=168575 RepID=A0AAD9TML2_9ROSI|nr:hypothetical protein Ddye_026218 [Dipteronia dyeriana]
MLVHNGFPATLRFEVSIETSLTSLIAPAPWVWRNWRCSTIVWRVWSLRNAKTHGAPYADVCDVFDWAKCFFLEYKECNVGEAQHRSVVCRKNVTWSPPSPGLFKVNCDAAIDVRGGRIGSAKTGLCPCNVESDAEVVVRWINDGSHLDSMCGAILADISLISSEMIGMSFNYVPRQANRVAHMLDQNALLLTDDRFWMEEYPCCVTKVVQADMPV